MFCIHFLEPQMFSNKHCGIISYFGQCTGSSFDRLRPLLTPLPRPLCGQLLRASIFGPLEQKPTFGINHKSSDRLSCKQFVVAPNQGVSVCVSPCSPYCRECMCVSVQAPKANNV